MQQYYLSPYTLFTILSLAWIFTSCLNILYTPLKLMYGFITGLQKSVQYFKDMERYEKSIVHVFPG